MSILEKKWKKKGWYYIEKDKLTLLEIIFHIEGDLQNLKELESELDSIKK